MTPGVCKHRRVHRLPLPAWPHAWPGLTAQRDPGTQPAGGGRRGERGPFTPNIAVRAPPPPKAEPPPSPPLSQPFRGRWSGFRGVWAALTFLSLEPVPKLAENSRFFFFFPSSSLPLSPPFLSFGSSVLQLHTRALRPSPAWEGGAEGQLFVIPALCSPHRAAGLRVGWDAWKVLRGGSTGTWGCQKRGHGAAFSLGWRWVAGLPVGCTHTMPCAPSLQAACRHTDGGRPDP